ncbi:MAG: hypothetical protein E7035_02175 [Verrucomicrobiaceae bacterium]|nr:hypothetical protein [Verrucomicrobiaceae bacterium]
MNDGFVNENDLVDYIDKKKYNEYNGNIKKFLTFLFSTDIDKSLPFSAKKITGQIKPDLYIEHKNIRKYVSLKKGSGNSVHQEKISDFFPFVEEVLGVEQLNNLKLFHYGDDTLNDSGKQRYSASECKRKYTTEIQNFNKIVNQKNIINIFLDRFLFVGNVGNISVDVIYHGTKDEGSWASKKEINNYVLSHNFDSNAIHFGPLNYQVWGRNEKKCAVHPDRRYVMQVKWSSLAKDLNTIRKGIHNE